MKELEGKTAVVTGAASGIGRALAVELGGRGMNVVLGDLEEDSLATATDTVRARGAEALAVLVDVTKAEQVERLAARARERFGEIHVVCNNAGVFAGGLSWEAPVEDYEWVLGVNVWGVIHGIRTFVPIMLEQGTEGHVVNTASMAAVTSAPLTGAYNMSKHAVLALSESLYHELTMQGAKIGCSVLCPEAVSTSIGHAERNRPKHLAGAGWTSPEKEVVADAIRAATKGATPPSTIAARTVEAIRENRFYILSTDGWRRCCESRLEDIRLGRNPTLALPVDDDGNLAQDEDSTTAS